MAHNHSDDSVVRADEIKKARAEFLKRTLPEVPLTGVIVVDDKQIIVKCNNTAEDLFLYPEGKMVGMTLHELIPKGKVIGQVDPNDQSDIARQHHEKLVGSYFKRLHPKSSTASVMTPRTRSVRGLRFDGSTFVVDVHLQPDGRTQLVTAFIRDMTTFHDSVVSEAKTKTSPPNSQHAAQHAMTALEKVSGKVSSPKSSGTAPAVINETGTDGSKSSTNSESDTYPFDNIPNTANAADMHLTVLTMQMMYHAKENNSQGIKDIIRWAEAARGLKGERMEAVKFEDYDGRIALHVAAANNRAEIAKMLIQCRADPNHKDTHGHTPLTEAKRRGYDEICQILIDAGAIESEAVQKRPEDDLPTVSPGNSTSGPMKVDGGDSSVTPLAAVEAKNSDETDGNDIWTIDVNDIVRIGKDYLGKGANGEVFLARWKGTKVAVKTMKTAGTDPNSQAWRDFKQEVKVMRTLRHPNIVQFFGASILIESPVIVTEYMSAGSLYVHLRACAAQGKVLDRRTVLKFAMCIASGCCYLHSFKPPCIHRDIKPSNLLIDNAGNLKLADFGLAKFFDHDRSKAYNMTGETGTYRYMAPEVFRHEPYSEKVDQYSFAMVVWEMMEGESPFNSRSGVNAAFAAERGRRPRFSVRYMSGVQELISACWHADPDQRPTFDHICDVLDKMSAIAANSSDKQCHIM